MGAIFIALPILMSTFMVGETYGATESGRYGTVDLALMLGGAAVIVWGVLGLRRAEG